MWWLIFNASIVGAPAPAYADSFEFRTVYMSVATATAAVRLCVVQPLPNHTLGYHDHLSHCVPVANLVQTGKLPYIARQVLRTHLMASALISTLHDRPKRFNAVSVSLLTAVLSHAVLDAFVPELQHPTIGAEVVSFV